MASASEKLRALPERARIARQQADEYGWDGGSCCDNCAGPLEDVLDECVAALPLIADVVEVAEVYAPVIWRRDASDGHTLNGIELRRRLTALREHLEGSGDD